jgi:hypothetical protein
MSDALWQDVASQVASDVMGASRDEAVELYLAEAARLRVIDGTGPCRVVLRCGVTIEGVANPPGSERLRDHLCVRESSGRDGWIPSTAIVRLHGALAVGEDGAASRSLGSWLRERWAGGDIVRLLDRQGCWTTGAVDQVGADGLCLAAGGSRVVIPFASIDAIAPALRA